MADAGVLKAVLNLENTQFINAMDGAIGALSKLGVAAAVFEFASDALEATEKVDRLHDSFITLNGATAETEQLFSDLSALETTSMFDFEDTLGPAARTMLSFGMEASKVQGTMAAMVDTAAGLKMDPTSIEAMGKAFAKMDQEGVASTKTMKALNEASQGQAYDILAEKLGVDLPKAMELVKDGAISSKTAIAAITEGMGERFGGEAQKMTQTWAGAMNALDQGVEEVMVSVGTEIKSMLTSIAPLLQQVVGFIVDMAHWFSELPGPVKQGVLAFTAIITAIATMNTLLPILKTGFTALTGAISGPTLAITLAVAALVALGTWVYQNWDPIVATLTQAWEGLKEVWTTFATWVTTFFTDLWGGAVSLFHSIFDPFITFLTSVFDVVVAAWNVYVGIFSGIWSAIWGGLMLLWDTVYKPFFDLLANIFAPVADAFRIVWDGIVAYLGGIWEGIKSTANSVWTSITGAIQKFLEFCQNIPGVNKLFNLTEAWTSAQKLKEETEKTTTAAKDLAGETKKAGKASAKYSADLETETDKKAKSKAATEALKDEKAKLAKETKFANDRVEDMIDAQGRATIAAEKLKERVAASWVEMQKFAGQVAFANEKIDPDFIKNALKMKTGLEDIKTPLGNLESGMKTLGITSVAEMTKVADEAKKAYDAVVASGMATQWEKDSALIKLMEAQMAKAKAMGEQIPKDQLAMLEKLKTDTELKLPEVEKPWEGLATNVSTVITNFAQDISKSLWDGDLSWGEKGKALLKSLGEAVTSSFLEPATAAIGEFIKGALADLMGGKGFGGLLDQLEKIGTKIVDVFSKTDAATGVPKVPSTGGGGGGGGGGAGAAMSGAMGWANLAFAGISAVSGIIGNFQNARQENTLNAIEHEVRYSQIHLFYILDNLNTQLPLLWYLPAILQFFQDWNQPFWEIRWGVTEMYNALADGGVFGRIALGVEAAVAQMGPSMERINQSLETMTKELVNGRILRVEVTATGVTTKEAATALGNQIATNLAGQMVQTAF